MSHTWKANLGPDRHKGEIHHPTEDGFELHAEDVWEDNATGRFAREQWSEAARKRRSKWLGKRLKDVQAEVDDDDLELFELRA